jgi:hypothetical protein
MGERRLLFVCYPDTDAPIGGVKQIYRQVELLHQAGRPAWVLHRQPGFRASWFDSTAPVLDLEAYQAMGPSAERDLIVLPETWLTSMPGYLAGIPKVIFNQNGFYSFGLDGQCDPATLELYQHRDLVGVVCVSHDSRDLLVQGCGIASERCHVVLNGIDPHLFHMPSVKTRRIVFLGRKQADHARKVALMARTRPGLQRYAFRELPRMAHAEVARELREALVFLSCGHPEGFGLPLAEALACGCMVVGYHGLGGRDFALPWMEAVEFGDLLGFLKTLERCLERFEQAPQEVLLKRQQAAQAIQQRYSPEAELEACLAVWGQLANSC